MLLAKYQIEQIDNNLPLTSFKSKMARLNSECSDPLLQANCLPGQKWRCINEDGQWRKHKCKFHVCSLHIRYFFYRLNTMIIKKKISFFVFTATITKSFG